MHPSCGPSTRPHSSAIHPGVGWTGLEVRKIINLKKSYWSVLSLLSVVFIQPSLHDILVRGVLGKPDQESKQLLFFSGRLSSSSQCHESDSDTHIFSLPTLSCHVYHVSDNRENLLQQQQEEKLKEPASCYAILTVQCATSQPNVVGQGCEWMEDSIGTNGAHKAKKASPLKRQGKAVWQIGNTPLALPYPCSFHRQVGKQVRSESAA
ncbi:hypothetical protein BKA64DRAFT_43628 [Cadophora sp. MPI-SDFR-AT-0126]|nr:hypothetical protein BKA64DRAFT_43628 [Leotiomycetes sp. MPI-SDFR-AT-0126]